MGDPTGVGPEVLLASLRHLPPRVSIRVIGDSRWLERVARRAHLSIPWGRFHWIDLANVPGDLRPGGVRPSAGKAAYAYLVKAVELLKQGQADGLVTAPVSKEAIVRAGIDWVGHTEFLGKAFRAKTVMMFVAGRLKVSLVTTHVALRDLPGRIRRAKVVETLKATRESMIRDFGIRRPRIGLAALNPHGGEGGLFGEEEKRILAPAVRTFRHGEVEGPLPADSLMRGAARGDYDAVVALYHDQALIPVKLVGWEEAVNLTLGLPFVRTSPVHGTGFDIAGKSKADPRSMRAAIELAVHLARRRRALRR
ncbi:MAG: 4-hydroxythreonine-4-phosphate dehydrogenase PdxA [Candidatus Omnitrophica bacterium]|nr:4-hydroxythreonine-4-phosphate dehydrogenase PdxA [Candidatus Omnitrophota bacterium]